MSWRLKSLTIRSFDQQLVNVNNKENAKHFIIYMREILAVTGGFTSPVMRGAFFMSYHHSVNFNSDINNQSRKFTAPEISRHYKLTEAGKTW